VGQQCLCGCTMYADALKREGLVFAVLSKRTCTMACVCCRTASLAALYSTSSKSSASRTSSLRNAAFSLHTAQAPRTVAYCETHNEKNSTRCWCASCTGSLHNHAVSLHACRPAPNTLKITCCALTACRCSRRYRTAAVNGLCKVVVPKCCCI
jgi:hypothetical protein